MPRPSRGDLSERIFTIASKGNLENLPIILLKDLNVISKFLCSSENHKLTADCAHLQITAMPGCITVTRDFPTHANHSKAAQAHTAQTAIKQVLEPGCLDGQSDISQEIRTRFVHSKSNNKKLHDVCVCVCDCLSTLKD